MNTISYRQPYLLPTREAALLGVILFVPFWRESIFCLLGVYKRDLSYHHCGKKKMLESRNSSSPRILWQELQFCRKKTDSEPANVGQRREGPGVQLSTARPWAISHLVPSRLKKTPLFTSETPSKAGPDRHLGCFQEGFPTAWQNWFHSCLPVGSGFGVCLLCHVCTEDGRVQACPTWVSSSHSLSPLPDTMILSLGLEGPHCMPSLGRTREPCGCRSAHSRICPVPFRHHHLGDTTLKEAHGQLKRSLERKEKFWFEKLSKHHRTREVPRGSPK